MASSSKLPQSRAVRWGLVVALAVVALAAGVQVGRHGLGVGRRPPGGRGAPRRRAARMPAGKPQRLDQWRGPRAGRQLLGDLVRPVPRGDAASSSASRRREGGTGLAVRRHRGRPAGQGRALRRGDRRSTIRRWSAASGAMELSRDLGNRLMALPFTIVLDRAGPRRAHAARSAEAGRPAPGSSIRCSRAESVAPVAVRRAVRRRTARTAGTGPTSVKD